MLAVARFLPAWTPEDRCKRKSERGENRCSPQEDGRKLCVLVCDRHVGPGMSCLL